MKNKITLTLILFTSALLFSLKVNAQSWQTTYASPSNYESPSGLAESGGNYIIGGQWGTGSNDLFFMITNNSGTPTPSTINRWALASNDFSYAFRKTTTGYVMVGNTFIGADRIPYILNLDNTGNVLWSAKYARSTGATNDYGSDGLQTADGGFVFVSQTNNCNKLNIVKASSTGAVAWQRELNTASFNCWSTWSIEQTTDGGFILGGYNSQFGAGSGDLSLIKLDASSPPAVSWMKVYGRSSYESAWGYPTVKQTSDGGYIIAGCTNGFGSPNYTPPSYVDPSCACPPSYTDADCVGGSLACLPGGCTCQPPPYPLKDVYVVKTDATGSINNNATSWAKTYRTTDNDYANGIIQTTDGGYVIVGHNQIENGGDSNVMLLKIAGDGGFQWGREFGSTSVLEYGMEVIQTTDGGFLAGGTSSISNVYLIKMDASGNSNTCQINYIAGVASDINLEVTNANTNAGATATTVTNVALASITQTTPSPAVVSSSVVFTGTTVTPTVTNKTCAALPLRYTIFSGRNDGDVNVLEWETATEKNNNHFIIERAAPSTLPREEDLTWEAIGKVKGAGNSNTANNYQFTDSYTSHLTSQTLYYRLRQVDYDGNFTYSKTISVASGQSENLTFKISPNPAKESLQLTIRNWQSTNNETGFTIYDILGREVYKSVNLQINKSVVSLDINNLSQGMYLLKINNSHKQTQIKFIKS